jgi:hypothetical protein
MGTAAHGHTPTSASLKIEHTSSVATVADNEWSEAETHRQLDISRIIRSVRVPKEGRCHHATVIYVLRVVQRIPEVDDEGHVGTG